MKLPAAQSLSGIFGVLMTTAPTVGSTGAATSAIGFLAVLAVLAGLAYRPAATLAVLLTAAVIVVADPAPVHTVVSALCAALYLVLRHTGTVTAPTMIAAVGFGVAGLVATAFPVRLPWLPLLAPMAVLAIYVLAVQPFLGARR